MNKYLEIIRYYFSAAAQDGGGGDDFAHANAHATYANEVSYACPPLQTSNGTLPYTSTLPSDSRYIQSCLHCSRNY